MQKGQLVELTIEDMSNEGQGIGRAEGLVIFVPDTVPGDQVRAELTKVKKNYAFSRLVELIEPSDARSREFDCEFFERGCGGCGYGRLTYEAQVALKERQVREKLQRLAGLNDPKVWPIVAMKEEDNEGMGPFRYRNKAQFPVSTGGIITRKGGVVENLGEPAVGFYRAKSHEVVDCTDCYLQSLAAMAAADALRRFMAEDNITAWDPKWEKGLLRHLIVKTAFNTGEVMVILVINGKGIPNAQKLIEMLDDAIYDVGYSLESVVFNVNRSPGKSIMGEENIVIAGKPVIRETVGDLTFEISPHSFYQVNPVQMKRLYDKVKEYCGLSDELSDGTEGSFDIGRTKPERNNENAPVILDLYCGVGTIGLYCANEAGFIIGIESVKEAVVDANRNAVINGIVNARYICGKAEEMLGEYAEAADSGKSEASGKVLDSELIRRIRCANIAILDPPRAGCKPELLQAVASLGVQRIVYVSCDPATLARDVKLLGELDYEFQEATPVDMFPWTTEVECVALLTQYQ
ncbi:MAG: 23S rRNA (uracil(1939)-C(5))-methyltransferase RlmD [Bacillota bacterium]|nr:23S rRNA (uracil(1939)-C(5))-methyltransferase RlmD [Bacillota bacterium]